MQYAFRQVSNEQKRLWLGFSAITLASIFTAAATGWYYLAGLPALLLLIYLTAVDFRTVFFLLLACIPLSTELSLPNGFGTDLPTEPLIVGLMGVYLLYIARYSERLPADFFRHPITLLMLLHIGWIFVATVVSELFFISFKYFLAKFWYVITFYFLAGLLMQQPEAVRRMFWFILLPLLFTIAVVWARHAAYGFSFESVYRVLSPFYRNHVTYAALMATFTPIVWFIRFWYKPFSMNWLFIVVSFLILLIAIQLSYTRAAYAAIAMAAGGYFIVRFRLMKAVLAIVTILTIALVSFLVTNNRYLELAPNYERTITHTDFNNLLEATYQLEDISTMERVYRWVAGGYMSKEHPVFGFGPGNFYNFYWPYTVLSFQTYVSDNPEKSGIHSYYLMVLVEQGYVGLIIFMSLLFYALIRGESIYHQTQDIRQRQVIMMAILVIIVISALQLINDLIETDKVGPFFFISLALLVNADIKNQWRAS